MTKPRARRRQKIERPALKTGTNRKKIPKRFNMSVVQTMWDNKKTLRQNYQVHHNNAIKQVGVVSYMPEETFQAIKDGNGATNMDSVDLMQVEASEKPTNEFIAKLEEMAAVPEYHRPRKMCQADELYMGKLIKKHGDNLKSMERDMTLNFRQLTEAQLRRLVEQYNNDVLNK